MQIEPGFSRLLYIKLIAACQHKLFRVQNPIGCLSKWKVTKEDGVCWTIQFYELKIGFELKHFINQI